MKKERSSGKLQASPCPICGCYMTKVPAYIDQEIKPGPVYQTISFNIVMAWVCRTCMEKGKS